MAVSRGTLMFCCLGTLLVILLFFISTAEAGDQHKIHAVRHGGGDGKGGGCKGGFEPENGNQCHDDDDQDDDDMDDDVDDTYKIVNNVKVSLSSSGKLSTTTVSVGSATTLEDDDDSADSDDQASKPGLLVLGH
ncbi:hypothetical protein CsatB_020099 [Cannabis sativa]